MIFYATALSSYSAKVRLVLCIKGVDFEEREPPGGYRSEAYRALVPMGTLPAIQEGDWVLSESEAINEYLEERYTDTPMLPDGFHERARVRFLARFHDLYLEPSVRDLFPKVRDPAPDGATLQRLRGTIEHRLHQLAGFCQPSPWLAGDRITLADCGPLVTLPLAQRILARWSLPLDVPAGLAAWLAAGWQDPRVHQALASWQNATDHWLTS